MHYDYICRAKFAVRKLKSPKILAGEKKKKRGRYKEIESLEEINNIKHMQSLTLDRVNIKAIL